MGLGCTTVDRPGTILSRSFPSQALVNLPSQPFGFSFGNVSLITEAHEYAQTHILLDAVHPSLFGRRNLGRGLTLLWQRWWRSLRLQSVS